MELAQTICRVIEENEGKSHFAPIYPIEATVEEKITAIAQKIYGAKDVSFTAAAQKSLKDIKALGGDSMPVCIADVYKRQPQRPRPAPHCWNTAWKPPFSAWSGTKTAS